MKCKHCQGSGVEPDNKAIGQAMREKREKARKTQREVANKLGFQPPYISDLENGNRRWSVEIQELYEKSLKP